MQYSRITPAYGVAPQIEPTDAEHIRAEGFTDVICNRPDEEVPPDLSADALLTAIEAAGLRFHLNPVASGAMTEENVARQAEILAQADGPVLAFCRSGTRSTIVWALGERGMSADDIVTAGAAAGYDLAPYRGHIRGAGG